MQRFRELFLTIVKCGLLTALLSCPISAQTKGARLVPWPTFVANYLDGYFSHRPDLAVMAGRHEFDGRLPNWSRACMALMIHFLKEQRVTAESFRVLTRAQEFERQYLIAQINSDLYHLEVAETHYTNPTYYI